MAPKRASSKRSPEASSAPEEKTIKVKKAFLKAKLAVKADSAQARLPEAVAEPDFTDRDLPIEYVQVNPKMKASATYARYEAYKNARTVGEALDTGAWEGDFKWDFLRKYLSLKAQVRAMPPQKVQSPAPSARQRQKTQPEKTSSAQKTPAETPRKHRATGETPGQPTKACNCGAPMPATAKFCAECGAPKQAKIFAEPEAAAAAEANLSNAKRPAEKRGARTKKASKTA